MICHESHHMANHSSWPMGISNFKPIDIAIIFFSFKITCLLIPWDNPKSKAMFSSSLVLWVKINGFDFDFWVHGLVVQKFVGIKTSPMNTIDIWMSDLVATIFFSFFFMVKTNFYRVCTKPSCVKVYLQGLMHKREAYGRFRTHTWWLFNLVTDTRESMCAIRSGENQIIGRESMCTPIVTLDLIIHTCFLWLCWVLTLVNFHVVLSWSKGTWKAIVSV